MKIFSFLLTFTVIGLLHAGNLPVHSSELKIPKGSVISVDGKLVGTAPCNILLTTDVRHKIEIKSRDGNTRNCYFTVKSLKESELVNSIPAWFFNPTMMQSDFRGYERLTPATASSAILPEAVSKAEADVRRKLKTVVVNQYNTIREPGNRTKLDSSESKYYPKLTRGQMDSLNDVNGGIMVAQSFGESKRVELLEYEIQKVDGKYQVYLLAGEKQ